MSTGTFCKIVFGKPHRELTDAERVVFHQYMRKVSYYRRHEQNRTRLREEKRDRKAMILERLDWAPACMECGYDVHLVTLDFHHMDPSVKDDIVLKLPLEQAVEEARKCRLLCANCHRIAHLHENRPTTQRAGRPRQPDPILDRLLEAYGICPVE